MAIAAKKVIMVPPELLQRLQQTDRITTGLLTKVKLELDEEMSKIMSSDLSEAEKLSLYNETLQKFISLNRPNQPGPPEGKQPIKEKVQEAVIPQRLHQLERIPINSNRQTSDAETIVAQFPIKLRSKARTILHHLANQGKGWNQKGEWLNGDTPVNNSNILQLVDYAIRIKKPITKPLGIDNFLSYLHQERIGAQKSQVPDSSDWEDFN